MKKNENRKGKARPKTSGVARRSSAPKRTSKGGKQTTKPAKTKLAKSNTKNSGVQRRPSGTKNGKGKNSRTTKPVSSKRNKNSELEELQKLFFTQLQQREEKKNKRKRKKGTAGDDRQTKSKGTHRSNTQSSVRPAQLTVRKKRGENLLKIDFDDADFQELVLGVWDSDSLKRGIANIIKKRIPNKVYVIIGVKTPQGEIIYTTHTSAIDQSVSTVDAILQFIASVIADYSNDMVDLLTNQYDQHNPEPWPIVHIGVRFSFPKS